jgi:hypothetical protein
MRWGGVDVDVDGGDRSVFSFAMREKKRLEQLTLFLLFFHDF